MWGTKNYDGDVQSDIIAQGRWCCLGLSRVEQGTLFFVCKHGSHSPGKKIVKESHRK